MAIDSNREKKRRKVDFRLEAPEASQVYLAGAFNNWSLKKHPMKKQGNGAWEKTLMLPAGNYEYKFWVDGRWVEDPNNGRRCMNSFGSMNSIVQICIR